MVDEWNAKHFVFFNLHSLITTGDRYIEVSLINVILELFSVWASRWCHRLCMVPWVYELLLHMLRQTYFWVVFIYFVYYK